MSQNGFFLNDIHIKKLDGSIGVEILVPNDDEQLDIQLYRPIFFFLGDVHQTPDFKCKPCHQHEKCYDTGDPTFLQLFDKYASTAYPIDFYIEGDWKFETDLRALTKNYYSQLSALSRMMIELEDDCFGRTYRDTDVYKKCPIKNIRLHRSDGRHALIKGENSIELFMFLTKNGQYGKKTPFDSIINPLMNKYDKNVDKLNISESDISELVNDICKTLYTSNYSAIRKQLNKATPFFTYQKFVELFKNIVTSHLNFTKNFYDGHTLWDTALSSMHDVYMILRVFKKLNNSNPPVLCIGNFGFSHVRVLKNLLVEHFNYSARFSKNKQGVVKDDIVIKDVCIEIDKHVDITDDFEHAKRRLDRFNSLGRQPSFDRADSIVNHQPFFDRINSIVNRQPSFDRINSIVNRQPSFDRVDSIVNHQPSLNRFNSIDYNFATKPSRKRKSTKRKSTKRKSVRRGVKKSVRRNKKNKK